MHRQFLAKVVHILSNGMPSKKLLEINVSYYAAR